MMKTSKTLSWLLLAAATISGILAAETSCTKQGFREGGAIRFSASNSAARTRTAYSGEGTTGSGGLLTLERIDWSDGDLITIYSPQAVVSDASDPICDYRVDGHATQSDNLTSRATVSTAVAGRTLNWGTGDHVFYAAYPSTATAAFTTAEKAKTELNATLWKGTVASAQSPSANGLGGTASAPEIAAKMQYAHMFATAGYEADAPSVDLPFYPEFTAFEIQVGSGKNDVVDLTSFTLTAAEGQNAPAGDFQYLLADVDTETTGSDPLDLTKFAFTNTSQSITVDFTALSAGKLTVESGKPVTFTVIALPRALTGLSITFTGDQIGTRTLALNNSAGTPITYAARQKHRIYGLSFPSVVTAEGEEIEWDLEALGEDVLWDRETEYFFGNLPDATMEGLSDVTVAYSGGAGSFADLFVSYKTNDGGVTKTPVPFTLEYSENGLEWTTTAPDWLRSAPAPGLHVGSTTGEALSVTAAPQELLSDHWELYEDYRMKSDFDLSLVDVSSFDWVNDLPGTLTDRRTANCYVVQGSGTYKFPLVYGNGVDWTKNPTTGINEEAYRGRAGVDATEYRPDEGVTNYLGRFKDHLDNDIMSPYIAVQQSGKAMSAVLLWQDVPGLVDVDATISGSGENACVTFSVPKAFITQGNALVAVLVDDDNDGTPETIAWSWHIWVTEEDLTAVKAGSNGNMFAPVNLGWCDGNSVYYPARDCQVRVVQEGTGLTWMATLFQTWHFVSRSDPSSPYYQWGRKDPMQASNINSFYPSSFKTYYPSSPAYAPATDSSPVSIGTAIRNPYIYYSQGWYSTTYLNLWSSATNEISSPLNPNPDLPNFYYPSPDQIANGKVKTIYDPSPVGFRVPAPDAWGSFSVLNTVFGDPDSFGLTYVPSELFFPGAGYSSGTQLRQVGYYGSYWSSVPCDASRSYLFYFFDSGEPGANYDWRTPAISNRYGCSVRPVLE